jgi:hypothetical protein
VLDPKRGWSEAILGAGRQANEAHDRLMTEPVYCEAPGGRSGKKNRSNLPVPHFFSADSDLQLTITINAIDLLSNEAANHWSIVHHQYADIVAD